MSITAAAICVAGCGGHTRDFSVDKHGSFTCPEHGDTTDRCGVIDSRLVLNRVAGEYLAVWHAQYDAGPVEFYARRFDTRTGKPRSGPTVLFDAPSYRPTYYVTFDPTAREYVIASQGTIEPLADPPRVQVHRFDQLLHPRAVRRLGGWKLMGLASEPAGRTAAVGLIQSDTVPTAAEARRSPAVLRIETLDSNNATRMTERRSAHRGQGLAAAAIVGAYDPTFGRLLVAWTPGARPDRLPAFRFDSFAAPPADRSAAAIGGTSPSGIYVGLACNASRRDCLLVHDASDRHRPRIDGQLVDGRGRRIGRPFTVASGRIDVSRVQASANAYLVTWRGPTVADEYSGTARAPVTEARVAGPRNVRITRRYELFPGFPDVGERSDAGTRLVTWLHERPKKSFDLSSGTPIELRARLVK